MGDLNENNLESETECPDFNFIYADTELFQYEIAQLYSYTENHEFHINAKSFDRKMEEFNNKSKIWKDMEVSEHKSIIMRLMNDLELSQKNIRMEAARSLLYIAQGCWFELETVTDQNNWARTNSILLYNLGVFTAFVDLLNLEVESSSNGLKKIAISISDSEDLRIILSVLYIITEVIRVEKEQNTDEYREVYENFSEDIAHEIISTKLLEMITSFCSGTSPHFPIKKILLLLWKISLISLGGMDRLRLMKNESRVEAGLLAMSEDTLEIAKTMRPSTPPSIGDGLSNQNFKRDRNFRRVGKNDFLQLEKQNAEDLGDESSEDNEEDMPEYDDPDIPFSPVSPMAQTSCRLPWTPKVRQKDIDQFLNYSRSKFIGFTIPGDVDNLVGLPQPIHESVKTLRRHIYTSLSDIQIKKEIEITRNPISASKNEITVQTPAELLYQSILPKLPQYIIALLKILLAAAPTSKAKNESINILADILPEGTPITVTESTKLGIDVNRHKEIIVKTVSAILLLYLKHFKLNHIYQFEFMSQHLVFANCIPLILKFFNQNIMHYVGSRNNIEKMDFPFCVIGEQPELTFGVIEDSTSSSRNIFSCINLLRVLNKLTKWKNSRVMMLVVFKSAPILKKTLKVSFFVFICGV